MNDPVVDLHRTTGFQVDFDGSGHFFSGYAVSRWTGPRFLNEDGIVVATLRFTAAMASVYDAARYFGQVNLGLLVTNIQGTQSRYIGEQRNEGRMFMQRYEYDQPNYRMTTIVSALRLREDVRGVARELVMPLVSTSTNEVYKPLGE